MRRLEVTCDNCKKPIEDSTFVCITASLLARFNPSVTIEDAQLPFGLKLDLHIECAKRAFGDFWPPEQDQHGSD